MIEIEYKLPVSNLISVENKIKEIGFAFSEEIQEIDKYFDNSTGSIKANDSALRIRKTINVHTNVCDTVITFKGPKLDGYSVTRPEYETTVSDAETAEKILNSLGYFCVAPYVNKLRKTYTNENITACLDFVEDLGDYLELEILVSDDNLREESQLKIENTLNKLGYTISDTITTSYLSALQKS